MSIKLLKLLVLLGATVFLTSACSLIKVNNSHSGLASKATNVSVFFSANGGNKWRPMDAVPTTNGQIVSIDGLNVKALRVDPEDGSAVYLASFHKGLYYTYNIVKGWNQVTSLPQATINDVRVDPQNKCIIYAAISNRLYRSEDCNRSWSQVYFDSYPGTQVNTIAIDYNHPANIYIGTSRGNIIKSIDGGNSWRTIHRMKAGIAQLIISPINSSLLFMATVQNKIFSFTSNSNTNSAKPQNIDQNFSINNWRDFNPVLAGYNLGNNFRDIIVNPKSGAIFLATDRLILRSPNQGVSWQKIKLLSSTTDTALTALAINPKNSADIYYLTRTAIMHSLDGGISWKTQKLPAGRAGQALLIDWQNPNNIYLGTIKINN